MTKDIILAKCKDVFNAFLVSDSDYDGEFEIPVINSTNERPNKLIPFSKSLTAKNFDCWVHFYEHDYKFIRVWDNPRKYLARLKKFNGIITPDFSLYRDMPLNMQIFNTYMGKALGHWWQSNGLNVIPNVRFADERSYKFCCDGVPKHSIISVGSLGCMRKLQEREIFKRGLEFVTHYLEPSCIVVYGSAPEEIFKCCRESEVEILQFDSEISQVKRTRKEVR